MNTTKAKHTPICEIIREKIEANKQNWFWTGEFEKLLERIQPIEEELQSNSVYSLLERMPEGVTLQKINGWWNVFVWGTVLWATATSGDTPQEALLALEAKLKQ